MANCRYINTEFWEDHYISELPKDYRYLWLYFLTNPATNIAGAYQIKLKRVVVDTDVEIHIVQQALRQFEQDGKMTYRDGWLFITNFIKHQSVSPKVQTSIKNILKNAPEWIQDMVSIHYQYTIDTGTHIKEKNRIEYKEERENAPAKNDFTTSEASDQLSAHLDFIRNRFNLIQLKNEREWMEAVFRCEREKVDFQKLFEFIESKRDPTKSGSVTPKMMLSDNWIASFKNPTPKKETKQNGTAYQSATDRNAANINYAKQRVAELMAQADELDAIDAEQERQTQVRGADDGIDNQNNVIIEPPGTWGN
jgi:hypothetical protein